MLNNVDRLLAEHKGRFTAEHLFAVTNLDMEESKRKPVLVPGHIAEGHIFNKHYDIEYVGLNENSTPAQKEKLEQDNIDAAKEAVEEAKSQAKKGKR